MQYGGTTANHIPSKEKEIYSPFQPSNIVLFTLLTLTVLSPVKAYSSPAPGSAIMAYASSQIGQPAEANTCEVFAEQALKGGGDPIPQQESATAAWSFFQANWQQYGPCQPQSWDASKAQAGDLVFWAAGQSGSTCSSQYGHVAIYDGAGGLIENAGRGITNDHSVNFPCTGSPTGFVPMTTCNGSSPSNSGTYTANGNTYSSFPQQNAGSMAALMPMMMMGSMMGSMMSPMMSAMTSAMSGLNSSGSGSSGTSSGTTGTSGTTAGSNATTAGSAGASTSTASTASSGTSATGAAATTAAGASPATAAGTTSPLTNLLTLIQNLLNNSGTAASGSSATTQASSGAAQDVEQVDQQGEDETANAEASPAAAADSAQTNNVTAPPDPTQDYHSQGNGHADYRLSCAYAAGASVANCRSATGAAQ